MAEFVIGVEDLAYARGQNGRVNKLVFGDRPWEACLLAQDAWISEEELSLGECILDYIVSVKQRDHNNGLHRVVRKILGWVFAPTFRSMTFTLPTMKSVDLEVMEKAYENEQNGLSDLMNDVLTMMSRINEDWAVPFFSALENEKFQLTVPDKRFILCCTRLLLARGWEDQKPKDDTAAAGSGRKKGEGKKVGDTSADKWAKVLDRQLTPVRNTGVIFNDVGGCRDAKRRMVELSWLMRQPEAVARWGVQVPRGVLLYGPPGTGKTLMVRALASHAGRALFQIKMSDIFSMWYSQSVAYLAQIFTQAKAAKGAILFFDEADGVIASRGGAHVHEESARIVTEFNIQMENITSEDVLTVILATNIKERLDEAAVRDQRIDLLIPVALPDLEEREEILSVHYASANTRAARNVFVEDVSLSALAVISEGLSGAGLSHVIERALWEKALHDVRDGISDDLVSQADMVRSIRERLAERKDAEKHIGYATSTKKAKVALPELEPLELSDLLLE